MRGPAAITGNLRARVEALNLRGWALRLIGDMAAYACDLEEEGRLAVQLGDGRALAHLRQRQAYMHRWFCRYGQALEAAEEGLCLSQAAGDHWLEGMCWREAGLAARALGEYSRAESALLRALDLIDSPEQAGLRVHLLGNLSTLYLYEGDFPRALDVAQQALVLCEQAQLHSSAGCPWAISARQPRRWATGSWPGAASRRAWPLPGRSRTAPRRSCAWGIWAGWICKRAR